MDDKPNEGMVGLHSVFRMPKAAQFKFGPLTD